MTVIMGRVTIIKTAQRENGKKIGEKNGIRGRYLVISQGTAEVEVLIQYQRDHVFIRDWDARGKVN